MEPEITNVERDAEGGIVSVTIREWVKRPKIIFFPSPHADMDMLYDLYTKSTEERRQAKYLAHREREKSKGQWREFWREGNYDK